MRRAWEAERDALAIVRTFNAILSSKGYAWFWPKITAAIAGLSIFVIALSLFAEDNRWFSIHSTSDTGPIDWNMELTAHTGGYFLGMYKQLPNQEIRILGFQAHGKNNSNDPISKFSGYIRSDLTNATLPIYIMAQDEDETKFPVCVPRVPTRPDETLGIPPFADFDVGTYEKSYFEPGKDGIAIEKFLNEFVPFTVVLEYGGTKVTRKFSAVEVQAQIDAFEKSASMQNTPRILRKANATPVPMAPLQLLKPQSPPPVSLPPLKLLIPPKDQKDDVPTGQIPSKH